MPLSVWIFEPASKAHTTSPFPFLCKAKQTRPVHVTRVTSAPTGSRDRHPTLPTIPPPPQEREISRELALLSELTEVTGELLRREGKVWQGGGVFAFILLTFMVKPKAFGDCQSLSNPPGKHQGGWTEVAVKSEVKRGAPAVLGPRSRGCGGGRETVLGA